jgi:hypothetical protein
MREEYWRPKEVQVLPNEPGSATDFSIAVTKKGNPIQVIRVSVFDDTSEASLTLWDAVSNSAPNWKPFETILLITNPGWRIAQKTWLSLTANTRVDVDPDISDAVWLRAFAQRLTKKENVNPVFPDHGQSPPSFFYRAGSFPNASSMRNSPEDQQWACDLVFPLPSRIGETCGGVLLTIKF